MSRTNIARNPEMGKVGPVWWHLHGMKMTVQHQEEKRLTLNSSAATLSITRVRQANRERIWRVLWEIRQTLFEKINGVIYVNDNSLSQAFALVPGETPQESTWLISRFGGTCARQGIFIRFHQYLNIPGPGTGGDGDPNISIEISEEIKAAVASLLSKT